MKKSKGVNSAKRIAFAGVMGATLVASKFALSFIPNVEVVTTLLVSFSFVFGFDGVVASLIFCTADVIIYPPSIDVIVSYYVYFNGLAILVAVLKELGVKNNLTYYILSVVSTAIFGVITSLFYSLFFGTPFIAIYLSGIVYYAIHVVSTAVFMFVGFKPVTNVLTKIKSRANL